MKSEKKIFLIEDELDILYIYKTALKAEDIDIIGVSSGKDAMEKIKEIQEGKMEKPALVLLDLVLPDINGLEILNAIRKDNNTKDIPVFILSNYTSDSLLGMKEIKPDKFLFKPDITPAKLVEIVKEQIK
jgi:CheY-like chemotaxis protein